MATVNGLAKLELALRELGQLDHGNLYLHHVLALLAITRHGSCTYAELERELGMSNASISRTVTTLSEHANHRKNVYGLVEISRDIRKGNRNVVSLTGYGRHLVNTLAMICDA